MTNSRTFPSLSSPLPNNPSSLTTITISDGVTTIGDQAFEDCSSLMTITIPDGVATIGEGAFYECSSLTSISNGLHTLTKLGLSPAISIGEACFSGCTALISAAADKKYGCLGPPPL
eukprot:CAMPEP_0118644116 /NCGR_PEP_ID=MMETSP0785-20121206/6760_1 /TAXON_ID=91992 /ORGANISM="Bolidomonas pacifica, Strain CCMP 1866" /LENGTH=116 /DNA_ID=CAMNT_0006535839 /DNA_START=244 /DNA_END=594 /DNA_ORIENTATION=+